MKTIKLLLLATVLSIMSCTSDNQNKTVTQPEIYGTWTVESRSQNGIPAQLFTCETSNTITFNQDASYSRQKYSVDENDECIAQNVTDTESMFSLIGQNILLSYIDIEVGYIEESGTVTNLTADSMDLTIEFADDDLGVYTYHLVR